LQLVSLLVYLQTLLIPFEVCPYGRARAMVLVRKAHVLTIILSIMTYCLRNSSFL